MDEPEMCFCEMTRRIIALAEFYSKSKRMVRMSRILQEILILPEVAYYSEILQDSAMLISQENWS